MALFVACLGPLHTLQIPTDNIDVARDHGQTCNRGSHRGCHSDNRPTGFRAFSLLGARTVTRRYIDGRFAAAAWATDGK
eukprot:7031573-Pyramimonas_sp.AAC.1